LELGPVSKNVGNGVVKVVVLVVTMFARVTDTPFAGGVETS
jgi:hypothetical protein